MIPFKLSDTIFALSSGKGKSGVAVFRVSGKESGRLIEELTNKKLNNFQPRHLYYSKIYDPSSQKLIDEGMIVYFQKGSSFTGEEALEIHLHGSVAVIKLMHAALFKLDYVRQAEAGEFTKRAFLNGKFDLTRAEAIADLIDAETEMQHEQAIRQLGGGLYEIYRSWREDLITIMAMIEAYIDFPDEEIPDSAIERANSIIESLKQKIQNHLNDNRNGERLRNGLKLAIIGRPNVGKSSLLNYLMQREMAIVSDTPGTTRDVIEGHLDIAGYPIILQDTAGIRTSSDLVENLGIEKAKAIQAEADIKIVVIDATELKELQDIKASDINRLIPDELENLIDSQSIILINKMDLIDKQVFDYTIDRDLIIKKYDILSDNIILTSTKNKYGLDLLTTQIAVIAENIASPSQNPQITRQRHRIQLDKTLDALDQFSLSGDLVLAAEDLRMTVRYLSNIVGEINVEEILGEIFSNFCIGK